MRFCPDCDNIMIPRKKKLYCKACDMEFDLDTNQQDAYKIVKTFLKDMKISGTSAYLPPKMEMDLFKNPRMIRR